MNFEALFKNLAEQYCNGRVDNLKVAVKKEINVLLRNKTTANALYEFFGVDKQNKNAKNLLIKKAVKLVEGLCLWVFL